jgi:hypothetical protein
MRTVIAKISVGQEDGVAPGTVAHLPAVGDRAPDVDQIDVAVVGLRRVSARRTLMVDGDEATPRRRLVTGVDIGLAFVLRRSGCGRKHTR